MALTRASRRVFNDLGIIAYVTAHKGGNMQVEVEPTSIDKKTGVVTLPDFMSGYSQLVHVTDQDELAARRRELSSKLPSHFTLQIAHATADDRIIVVQRERGDRYRSLATIAPFGELVVHAEPPCEVRTRIANDHEIAEQGVPRLSIWLDTQMQNQRGSNRADIIRVTEDGKVTLHRVLLLWLDGQFRLVQETGWVGQLCLRADPTKPYELSSEDGRISSAYFGNDEVRVLLHKYVFVPDMGFPSIEGWLQMLLLPKFRQLVQSTKDLEVWEGSEEFWSKPDPKILTESDTGIVEWYVYGTGGASMGYVHLHTSTEHNGRTVERVQIRHHSIDAKVDAQGLKKVHAGDIVRIHKIVNMDVTVGKPPKAKTTPHAPLGFVGVIYERREEGEEPADESVAA